MGPPWGECGPSVLPGKGQFSWPLETVDIITVLTRQGAIVLVHLSGVKGTYLPVLTGGERTGRIRGHSLGTERRGSRPHSLGYLAKGGLTLQHSGTCRKC